jgi:hypothetical protein
VLLAGRLLVYTGSLATEGRLRTGQILGACSQRGHEGMLLDAPQIRRAHPSSLKRVRGGAYSAPPRTKPGGETA